MKILLLAACIIVLDVDRGGEHRDEGEVVDAPKETARTLVGHNRALYVNRADDTDKGGRNTASKEMLAVAEAMAEEREAKANSKAPAAGGPEGAGA